jgi:PilZ domain
MTPWRRARGPGDNPASTIKRKYERYLVNTLLTAMPEVGDREIEVQGRALDVSENGVGGIFPEIWMVGSQFNLEIRLPDGHPPLNLNAIVRHRTGAKFRYGFEFTDVSPEQRKILQDACKALAQQT